MTAGPSWTFDAYALGVRPASKLRLWMGSVRGGDYREVELTGQHAELVCEALSAQHAELDRHLRVDPTDEPYAPDRADLTDWARRARTLADEIQTAAEEMDA